MIRAEELLKLVEEDLQEVELAIRAHPYVKAVRDGACPLPGLQAFVGTQYQLANSDARAIALMINRFGDRPCSPFFQDVMTGEFAAREGIVVLAAKLGMSEKDLAAYEPTAFGFAYGCYLMWLANHGTAAEIMSGMLVNFAAWGANCAGIGEGLRAHYSCNRADTAFVDGFAELPSFREDALPVIQEGLDHGEAPDNIRRAARLFQAYEKMFWDDMARAAEPG